MSPVSIHPRGNGGTCIRCRKKFERGDRVQIVSIIEQVGPNPSNPREIGAWFSEEFEVSHADCADPTLNGTIIVGGR
jgi:hypothetical protein